MTSKWFKAFDDLDGVISHDTNVYSTGICSPSPSVNFIFGNTHLVPSGSSVILWGPPKGGKSLLTNMIIGQLHKDDPDALVFKFDTEFREKLQMTPRTRKILGIDPDRYRCRETNKPEEIFDFIEKDIVAKIQGGAPIKLIVIDSVTDILGRRSLNSDSVGQQQIGDEAATLKDGLKRIKSCVKRHGITLLMIAQERAELDQLERMRGKNTKMAGNFYLKHFAEYFVYVAPNQSKEGRMDLLGNPFQVIGSEDMAGNADTVAHKIKVEMKESSVGVARRVGEFTFHKYQGLINTHEEVFRLGVARNVLEMPNNRSYIFKNWPEDGKESKWSSKGDCLLAIKQNDLLYNEIVKRVRLKDIEIFENGSVDSDFNAGSDAIEGLSE